MKRPPCMEPVLLLKWISMAPTLVTSFQFLNKVTYYSRLGRVMLWWNVKRNTWHCPCSKGRVSCLRREVVFLSNQKKSVQHKENWRIWPTCWTFTGSRWRLFRKLWISLTSQYIHQQTRNLERWCTTSITIKKLPAVLPVNVTQHISDRELFPTQLFPKETFCTHCPGNIPPMEPVMITGKARILTLTSVFTVVTTLFAGISTFCRRCPQCNLMYRYQEWSDGLHNYNDHIIISLHLCLFFRGSIKVWLKLWIAP